MKGTTSIKLQLGMAIAMVLISIYMTFSYYNYMTTYNADISKSITFYAWIFSILAWLAKVIYDLKKIRKLYRIH
jgi:hypothetical protein